MRCKEGGRSSFELAGLLRRLYQSCAGASSRAEGPQMRRPPSRFFDSALPLTCQQRPVAGAWSGTTESLRVLDGQSARTRCRCASAAAKPANTSEDSGQAVTSSVTLSAPSCERGCQDCARTGCGRLEAMTRCDALAASAWLLDRLADAECISARRLLLPSELALGALAALRSAAEPKRRKCRGSGDGRADT